MILISTITASNVISSLQEVIPQLPDKALLFWADVFMDADLTEAHA